MSASSVLPEIECTSTWWSTPQSSAGRGGLDLGTGHPARPFVVYLPNWYVEMDELPRRHLKHLLPLKIFAGLLIAYVLLNVCCLIVAIERRVRSEPNHRHVTPDTGQGAFDRDVSGDTADAEKVAHDSSGSVADVEEHIVQVPSSLAPGKLLAPAPATPMSRLIEPLALERLEATAVSGKAIPMDPAVLAVLEASEILSNRLRESLSRPRAGVTLAAPPRGGVDDRSRLGAGESVAKTFRRGEPPLPRIEPIAKFPSIRGDIQAHADYVYSQVSQVRGSRVAWHWKQRILRMEDRLEAEFRRRYAATGDEFGSRYLVLSKLPTPRFRTSSPTISLADL